MEINLKTLTEKCGNSECPLIDIIQKLIIQNTELTKRVKELEARLNMDSSNSSKPPSSDGLKRNNIKSLREKSGKKPGGQHGHNGSTLKMSDNPDEVIVHTSEVCEYCGEILIHAEEISREKRQVLDIKIITYITEHIAVTKECSCCRTKNKPLFPVGVENNVQYGFYAKSIFAYLSSYQLLPYERTAELMTDIFGINVSEATLVNTNNELYEKLEGAEKQIKELLLNSALVHKDETGIYINGKLNWLHGTSNEIATYYQPHSKRGIEAMKEDDFLPKYNGIVVHDFWKPYFKFVNIVHALCNAHLLREMKAVKEEHGQEWSEKLPELLIEINNKVKEAKEAGQTVLIEEIQEEYSLKYDRLIAEGLKLNPETKKEEQRKGKAKQSKSFNLLIRLKEFKSDVLRFMRDFRVPFTNNQAERDIRMVKVKQKISGTFRSTQGVQTFFRNRGYISTIKKNEASVIEEIHNAFLGNSFMPSLA